MSIIIAMDESIKSKLYKFLDSPKLEIALCDSREVEKLRERISELETTEKKLRRELQQTYDVLGMVSNRNQILCDALRDAGITIAGQ